MDTAERLPASARGLRSDSFGLLIFCIANEAPSRECLVSPSVLETLDLDRTLG